MNKTLTTLFALAVASVTALSHAQEAKGDVEAGKQKIAMCIGCHGIVGYQASFPEIHKVPMISGQSAKYIAAALVAYQKGERKHPTMRGIAMSLSDADMADLAAYYEKHGASSVKTVADTPVAQPSTEVAALLTKGYEPAEVLVAATRLGGELMDLPVGEVKAVNHEVVHAASGRKLGYGALAQADPGHVEREVQLRMALASYQV